MADFGDEVRRLLAERGMSLRELARRSHYHVSYLSNVCNGRKRPTAQMAAELDELLGAGGKLATRVSREWDLPGAATEVPHDALELIELARRAGHSDLSSGVLEALQMVTDGLCRDYTAVSPPVLRDRATGYLRYVVALLDKRATLSQHRELLVTAGWLAALLACTCYDGGDPATAETARTMTRQFGEDAGHGELVGWSFEIAAWFALVEGRFAQTVALCEAGIPHAGVSSAGVQLTLQASRGYARMGDGQAARMLQAGQEILSRLPEPGQPRHHFVFDHDKFEFYVATIYTWLGTDDAAAREHAQDVVTRCRTAEGSVRWPMRLANARIDLGLLAGRHGDLDEAVAHGSSALKLERRSASLLPRAAELGRHLAARFPRERLVAEYKEMLAGERSAALPAGEATRPGEAEARQAEPGNPDEQPPRSRSAK